MVRDAVALYDVLSFLTLRFALAALALVPYTVSRVSRRTLAAGASIGLVLAVAYLFQTAGLLFASRRTQGSSPGSSSSSRPWRTSSSSGRGLAAGSRRGALEPRRDGLSGRGQHRGRAHSALRRRSGPSHSVPLPLRRRARRGRPRLSAVALDAGRLRLVLAPLRAGCAPAPGGLALALVAARLVASAGAFWVQTFVQQRIPAGSTAVILTIESVFAVLFGYWLAGDRLIPVQMVGAA